MCETFKRNVVIDGKGHLLGRLASVVAKQLLLGTKVAVVRTEEISISGSIKRNQAIVHDRMNKRMNTNPRRGPFHPRTPATMFYKVVRAMVPYKTSRGQEALRRLQVYEGVPVRFQRSKRVCVPSALKVGKLRPGSKSTKLGRLATSLGWKYGKLVDSLEQKRKVQSAVYFNKLKKFRNLWKKASDSVAKNDSVKKINEQLAKLGY